MTLVQRLASGGAEEDWRRFLKDYWGPICRFSLRFGAQNLDEAEQEFAAERQQLGQYLSDHGGLEETVKRGR